MRSAVGMLGLLLLPMTAGAADSSAGAVNFILDVEWSGTVETRTLRTFAAGDAIHGTVRMNSALAPPDILPDPNESLRFYNEAGFPPRVPAPSGFVVSDWSTLKGESEDRIAIADHIETKHLTGR